MRTPLFLAALLISAGAAVSAGGPASATTQQIADSPDLPTVAVQPHAVHSVPDQGEPAPPPPAAFSRAAPPPPRAIPRHPAGPAPLPGSVNGLALPISATMLSVVGHQLQLFGVEPADAKDLCPLPAGPAQPCSDVARNVLGGRLHAAPAVSCRAPPGQRGAPGYICHDGAGVDLAELLVANGLALADTHQSYQYFNAEKAARAARRGLWRYR